MINSYLFYTKIVFVIFVLFSIHTNMLRKFIQSLKSKVHIVTQHQFVMSTLAKDKCKLPRGNFNKVEEKHVSFFKNLLGNARVITNIDDLNSYNAFWLKHFKGSGQIVLRPKTTEEVSKILAFCNDNHLAVCPQGGNTSICGGSISIYDEIILSLSLMNNILDLNTLSDVLICEAGCVLENIQNFLEEKNLMIPVDLASKGTCQIGGNISTNAGGLKVIKYGNLHGTVLGLEIVKANGEIVDCLNVLKKDNSGYHLKHLFIGSEGTLGVVTKIAIQCVTLPKYYSVAFLGKYAKVHLNETLSACEMMDYESMDMVQTHLKLKNAIGNFPFYMLVESSGCNKEHNEEKINVFLESVMNDKIIVDGTVSSDPSKCKVLWEVRERVAESFQYDGHVLIYDVSLPLEHFYTLVPEMTTFLGDKCKRVSGLGHLGDCNLHLQITLEEYNEEFKQYIDDIVHKKVSELKGSISAEHGIGFMKTDILHYTKSQSAIQLMKEMKKLLDPNGILNPYKVLKM